MAELRSALLFGVSTHFKIKMGANTPGSVWFGFIWFGWYGLDLFDGEEKFLSGEYYCHNPNSTLTFSLVRHENGSPPPPYKTWLLTI